MRKWVAGVVLGAVAGSVTTFVLIVFLFPPATWAQSPTADTLRASRFELVDAQGVVRGTWSIQENIRLAQLHMRDEFGDTRVQLEASAQGAYIGLKDRSGRNTAQLVQSLWDLGLIVGDQEGQTAGVLASTGPVESYSPSFVVTDRAAATGWRLGTADEARPQFEVRTPTGTFQWRVP